MYVRTTISKHTLLMYVHFQASDFVLEAFFSMFQKFVNHKNTKLYRFFILLVTPHLERTLSYGIEMSLQFTMSQPRHVIKYKILFRMKAIPYVNFYVEFQSSSKPKKFTVKDFFSKCELICSFMRICSHLLKEYSTENFIFCTQCSTAIYYQDIAYCLFIRMRKIIHYCK